MKTKKKSGMSYLFELAGKYKLHIIISVVFAILSALCSFIPYVMVYKTLLFLFDGSADYTLAMQYGIIASIAIIAKFVLNIISGTFSHIAAFNTLYNVRIHISRHIAKINLGFFSNHTSGEIKKVMIEDVERIEKFLAHQIPDISSALCVPIIIFVYLLTVNVQMALCLLIPAVLGIVIQGVATATTSKQMPTYHRLLGKLNSTIMQFINGMPVIKTYNMTMESYKEYSDTVHEYNAFWKESTRSRGYTYGLFITLIESGILFVLPIGGILFLNGSLVASDYLFFMIMSMVFLSSLLNLLNIAMLFSQIMSGTNRIQNIMEMVHTSEGTVTLDKKDAHTVSFKNVTFSYDQTDILKNINLTLPKGSLTAFVGASGAGKTTAAQLIPKFWEVVDGSVLIDDHNITDLKTENLMDLVSFVFQDTFMLSDSIYENIAIGSKTATREQVENAAKAAQIHDFINNLPNGYNTKLDEDGIKLSGGEKQRICIARAILKDAPIIVFDEATSYTDIENEHKIQVALANLLKDKTTVMIAHRLHTIINANQICVFDKGKIAEIGTHKELVDRNGLYADMWKIYVEEAI